MAVTSLDHVHAESHDWGANAAFGEELGLRFAGRRARDGHCAGRPGAGSTAVVPADIDSDTAAHVQRLFSLSALDAYAMGEAVKVVTPLEPTGWDTRWIRVEDPEGRVRCLEAHSEE